MYFQIDASLKPFRNILHINFKCIDIIIIIMHKSDFDEIYNNLFRR